MDSPRIQELRRRIQQDPASLAFAPLAEELRRAGRAGEAIALCRDGLARHPEYLSARATLGRALIDDGDLDAALAELSGVLASAPEHLAALRGLADIHRRRGEADQALSAYRRALSIARDDAEVSQAVAELEAELAPTAADSPPSVPAPSPVLGRLEHLLEQILAARAPRV